MNIDMSKREATEEIGEAEKKVFVEETTNGDGAHAVDEVSKTADVAAESALANKATLYHSQYYSSSPNVVVIHELGLKDKINVHVCKDGEHKTGELAAHNPHGFVRFASSGTFLTLPLSMEHFYHRFGADRSSDQRKRRKCSKLLFPRNCLSTRTRTHLSLFRCSFDLIRTAD